MNLLSYRNCIHRLQKAFFLALGRLKVTLEMRGHLSHILKDSRVFQAKKKGKEGESCMCRALGLRELCRGWAAGQEGRKMSLVKY